MPQIKSAKKKLRQDKKRTSQNLLVKKVVKSTLIAFKRKPSPSLLSKVFAVLDTSVKKNITQRNKANRLKSRLSKLISAKPKKTLGEPTPTQSKGKSPRKKKSSV